jgi:hypothetical protein
METWFPAPKVLKFVRIRQVLHVPRQKTVEPGYGCDRYVYGVTGDGGATDVLAHTANGLGLGVVDPEKSATARSS